jgi:DNA-binding transcriptional regulator YdaS (Cro superfamily)
MDTKAIKRACELAGGQTGLARRLKVSQGLVWQWVAGRLPVAAKRCLPIEDATGGKVTRYQLRPDVFGAPPSGPADQQAAA